MSTDLSDLHANGLAFGVAVGDELAGGFAELAHGLRVVVHGGLQGVVLLHQVLGGELVLENGTKFINTY